MNEVIIRLAEQAVSTHKQNLGVYQFYSEELEKFTELIVRECAVELMKLGNSYSECEADADYMQGMLDSADIIKEHFGIVNDD